VLAVDILVAEWCFLIGYMEIVFGELLTTLGAARKTDCDALGIP
jgi:hypothetical protein